MPGYPSHHEILSEADAKDPSIIIGAMGLVMRRGKTLVILPGQSAKNAGTGKAANSATVNSFMGLACIRCSPYI
ncbi:hypothetical protein [Methylobacter sp. YRD-M1]|uniref:hypothetical protein n=1 Tax=Methylobacter sp. YRD-M1 TaxID=2911520 RepID=UPI00227BEFDF|nr:hypothetical protein [Methylobacter sp. YRD-M1]WAK02644.1 hypothetical protein LZ558_02305 [Methylobacter sp. YRD-M1]